MASTVLSEFLNKKVSVITTDGRLYVGILEGYDHSTNVLLREAVQRDLSPERAVTDTAVGLFVIRGDCVALIGEVNTNLDSEIDWEGVNAPNFKRFR